MGWIKTFKNSDGTFDSFEWSLDDVFKVQAITLIVFLFTFILIGLLVPYFILLIHPITHVKKQRYAQYIVGITFCLLWIIDYIFLGFAYQMYGHIIPDVFLIIFINNISILVILTLFLCLDHKVYTEVQETKFPFLVTILIYITLFTFIHYKLTPAIEMIPFNTTNNYVEISNE